LMAGCTRGDETPQRPKAAISDTDKAPAAGDVGCSAAAKGLLQICPSCALDPKAIPPGFDCGAALEHTKQLKVLLENVGAKMPLGKQLVGTEWSNLESRTKVTFDAAHKACPDCFDRPPPSAAAEADCAPCFARPFEGSFTVSYPDGTRRVVGAYASGKLEGKVSTFHPNGIKSNEKSYRSGALHGPFVEWDEGSRKIRSGQYDEGSLHGDHSRFEGTRVVEQGAYQYGVRTGRWMKWYPSGKKRSRRSYQTKCEGRKCVTQRHGVFISWDEAGKIASMTQYANGKKVKLDLEATQARP